MRIGAVTSGEDPLTMSAAGNDYAELCDLGPSRWSSRGYHPPHNSTYPGSSVSHATKIGHHHRSNSFEAEDIESHSILGSTGLGSSMYSSRIGTTSSSFRGGRSGLYYSPPGTSYTIMERPHSPHYYYNTAGAPSKSSSLPGRGSTYTVSASSSHIPVLSGSISGEPGSASNSAPHNVKKRPISPEQVLRMFGATTSSSVPTSYHYSNGSRERGERRSPASSPPSTTHQLYRERDSARDIPSIHELSTRTVTISRDQQTGTSHGYGICVKAGKDAGVFITKVEEGSVAERAGLHAGDTILEVNGTPLTSISYDDALKKCIQILKSSREISMTVQTPPILNSPGPLHCFGPPSRDPLYAPTAPNYITGPHSNQQQSQEYLPPPGDVSGTGFPSLRQTCSWMDRNGRPTSPPVEYGGRGADRRDRIRPVELLIEAGQSLGLMIRGGVEYGLGIFITGVDKDSVADRAGLMIGDEILEVNGQSFLDVTHDEAVSQLKYHKRMSLLVRDVGKIPHSCTSIELDPWDAYSSTGTRARRKGAISTMVEEKARSLLPRHQFSNLSYYVAEYGAKAMTIDAFVAVLLEMLDTHEKHSLVTEIRELIFPEDRTRYDEMVYRRDGDIYCIDEKRDYNCEEPRSRRGSEEQVTRHGYCQDVPMSMQRLSASELNGSKTDQPREHNPNVVPDHRGNLLISVNKSKPILGIAIEGGANTKHPLPRIINIHENGAAYEAGGLEVGQLILEVDGNKVEGMHHQEVARLIAESFASRDKPDIQFLVVEAKKSNLEPKPTALIFLEA